jgi:hypothetical protein
VSLFATTGTEQVEKMPFNFFYNLKTIGFLGLLLEKIDPWPPAVWAFWAVLGVWGILGSLRSLGSWTLCALWALNSSYKKN